jgi:glycosyltransferase involved in cell wall biosynthesis
MKILILSHAFYPHIGGIEINSEILSLSFYEMNHEVHVVTWTPSAEANKFPFDVIRNPNLRKLFAEHIWADVILENNPCLRLSWPNVILRKASVVVLNTWITSVSGGLGIQERLKLWWITKARRVIAVSSVLRESCFKYADVVNNPYRTRNFRNQNNSERPKDFVFLGRLVSDKGVDLALRSLYLLNRVTGRAGERSSFTLSIIGDGPELANLRKLAEGLGVSNVVTFKGSLSGEELNSALNEHKYMLVPSLWREPFGNVALEGLACGCIPIVADGGGLPEAIGSAGLVFERGSSKQLFLTMKLLVSNTELECNLKSRAEGHLRKHHPDVVAKRYLEILNEAYHLRANRLTNDTQAPKVWSPNL